MHRFRLHVSLVLLLAIATGLAFAQDAAIAVGESPNWGAHLTDASGMSLYLYDRDEPGALACLDACTNNWPPVLVNGEVVVAGGLDPELADTVERPDGSLQATYGGHPLYTYARDGAAGDTNGQGLGGAFFLVSLEGTSLTERAERQRVEMDDDLYAALMSEGETAFAAQCAVCHAADGAGQIGPSLQSNDLLGNNEFLIGRILNGFPDHGMPAFRSQLTDREIAAIATFIRNSWENDFGGVFEEEVSELR